jgi:hypothetical protein
MQVSIQKSYYRDGLANFFLKSVNRKSAKFYGPFRNRKFLRYSRSQISNPQIYTSALQLCLKTVIKVVFFTWFLYYVQMEVPQI